MVLKSAHPEDIVPLDFWSVSETQTLSLIVFLFEYF